MRKILMITLLTACLPFLSQAQEPKNTDDWGSGGGGGFSCSGGGGGWGGGSWGGGWGSLGVIGLTRAPLQRLVCFNEYSPGSASNIGTISGLTTDTKLVGIDFRVQDGMLYGVGDAGGIYTLSRASAAATLVTRLTVALEGTSFGVDFNPAANALRIISNTAQNLRQSFATAPTFPPTVVDGRLNYTVGTDATGVVGAGYTNNDLDTNTATTLYDVDSNLDQVAIQSPANSGSLAATGKLTVNTSAEVGFDIYSTVRNGVTVEVQALATLTSTTGQASLYSVTLATGKAVSRGSFNSQTPVVDIAIPLNQL